MCSKQLYSPGTAMAWQSYLRNPGAAACSAARARLGQGGVRLRLKKPARLGDASARWPGVRPSCFFQGGATNKIGRSTLAPATKNFSRDQARALPARTQSLHRNAASGAVKCRRATFAATGAFAQARAVNGSLQNGMPSPSAADCLAMVGGAQEPDCAHAARHPISKLDKWAKVCARCAHLKWENSQRVPIPVWLRAKPQHMQGAWGIGCTMCAAGRFSWQVHAMRRQHMTNNKDAGRCKQAISRASGWSKYEKRAIESKESRVDDAIAQHAASDMHRLCITLFNSAKGHLDYHTDPRGNVGDRLVCNPCLGAGLSPREDRETKGTSSSYKPQPVAHMDQGGALKLSETMFQGISKTGSVDDPFRGRVPQCEDWLNVWAEFTSSVSNQGCCPFVSCRIVLKFEIRIGSIFIISMHF